MGMKKIVKKVVVNILFIIVIFIVFWLVVFVLLVSVNGVIFKINVIDVIRIGWKCWEVVFEIVVIKFLLFLYCFFVNLIIRIVFFVVKFMVVKNVICRYILFGKLKINVVVIELRIFKGIINIMVNGID